MHGPKLSGDDPNPVSISSSGVWFETGSPDHVSEHLDGGATTDLSPQRRRVASLPAMTRSSRPRCSSNSLFIPAREP